MAVTTAPQHGPAAFVAVFVGATALFGMPNKASGHEAGAPFSGAILDPLVLHHAHIENEQRLNTSARRGDSGVDGAKRWSFGSELELSWSTPSYDFGAEVFIPFENMPSRADNRRVTGVGDIELRPVKVSVLMQPELVVTLSAGVVFPTGSARDGLGDGNTTVSQLVFVDVAKGNWFLGFNAGLMENVFGTEAVGSEYGLAASYSLIPGTGDAAAAAVPDQTLVPALSLEVIGGAALAGEGAGATTVALLPGLSLWWPRTGWQLRVGVARPVYGEHDEGDWAFMLQVGNHRRWTDPFTVEAHK